MPKRISDDIDHVPAEPPAKKPKKAPPEQWCLPKFKPQAITGALTFGLGSLPDNVAHDNPYDIFSLFFTEEIFQTIADHTNEYAQLYPGLDLPYSRVWYPTTAAELKAFLGAYIWMGVHPEAAVEDFWNSNPEVGPLHEAVSKHISRNRWQQIDRFLHISQPVPPETTPRPTLFENVEPLNEHLRQAFKKYWTMGTHFAVDETIQRFMGRAKETVNIPSKPEPVGFKIWVLANCGYVLDWLYHAKGENNGPVDLDSFWTKDRGFSKSQAVVLDLLTQQGIPNNFQHVVWLDNLFTSARLLTELLAEGFGAAGTVRTQKTEREKQEESHGTKAQKINKEPNRGLHPSLSALKLEYNRQLEWGKLYGRLSDNGHVLEFAWKDQNVVLFMTTVHTGKEIVKRMRRRPSKTATNARTSRAVFGDQAVKELSIPEFIDMYNHFMNGVDLADQLRSYYNTQRCHLKTWKPLWHFLLDTAVVNAYKIAYCSPNHPWAHHWEHISHKQFRTQLASQLFANSERISDCGIPTKKPMTHYVNQAAASDHGYLTRINDKSKNCIACTQAGRKAKPVTKRKPFTELSSNTLRNKKRPEQIPKSRYGCALCRISLCNHILCWKDHINGIQ